MTQAPWGYGSGALSCVWVWVAGHNAFGAHYCGQAWLKRGEKK